MNEEINNLLNELRNMQSKSKNIPNNSDTWSKIGSGDWEGAGFENEDEMKQWISDNPYANI